MLEQYNNIKLLKADDRIIYFYRHHIKNNEDDDILTIRKKLTRNFILGIECTTFNNIHIRRYGCLEITVNLNTFRVIDIYNIKGGYDTYINKVEKENLNKLLYIK